MSTGKRPSVVGVRYERVPSFTTSGLEPGARASMFSTLQRCLQQLLVRTMRGSSSLYVAVWFACFRRGPSTVIIYTCESFAEEVG